MNGFAQKFAWMPVLTTEGRVWLDWYWRRPMLSDYGVQFWFNTLKPEDHK